MKLIVEFFDIQPLDYFKELFYFFSRSEATNGTRKAVREGQSETGEFKSYRFERHAFFP